MNLILLHLITSLGYLALAALQWKHLLAGSTTRAAQGNHSVHILVVVPLVLHAGLLARGIAHPDGLYLGVGNAISIIIALAVLIYWIAGFFNRFEALNALVLPAAAILSLLPLLIPPAHPLGNTGSFIFRAHLLIAMLAYSLFTIASLHVMLMAMVEKHLHSHHVPSFVQALPPLLTMESVLFKIIGSGFVLLTLTLATGVLFAEELFGKALPFTHKTVFGFISWFIFGALLAGRSFYGWRGRTAVRWTLTGFMMLVLAYIGSQFVVEIILKR